MKKVKRLIYCVNAPTLTSNYSGISMTVMSDQPGLQFYTGTTGIKDGLIGHDGKRLRAFFLASALKHKPFPDAPKPAAFFHQ